MRKLLWILLLLPQRVRKPRLRTPGVQATTLLPLNHGVGPLQRATLSLGIQKYPGEKVSDDWVSLFASLPQVMSWVGCRTLGTV